HVLEPFRPPSNAAEEERGLYFSHQIEQAFLVRHIRLEEERYGSFRPDYEIYPLGHDCTSQLFVARNSRLLELWIPFFVLFDVALNEADPKVMGYGQRPELCPSPGSPARKSHD